MKVASPSYPLPVFGWPSPMEKSPKFKSPRTRQRPASLRAFSLVEVTIAIGVVSFALLALLGIVPIGLMAAQEAMKQTARSHILQQISSDLGQLAFSQLDAYLQAPQYYDYDGKRLEQQAEAAFIADLSKSGPVYPGSTDLAQLQDRLEHVTVSIRRPAESADFAFRTTLSVFNSSGRP